MTIAHLSISGRTCPLLVRRNPRARRISLRVGVDGSVALTLPPRAALRTGLDFLETRRSWLVRTLDEHPPRVLLRPGALVPVDGRERLIHWFPDWPRTPRLGAYAIEVGGPREMVENRVRRWLVERGRSLLTERTEAIAGRYRLPVTRVRVGDPKTRWGSCTSDGVVSLSWRLTLAPVWVRDYVIAHELAHLSYMDHSPAFWRRVEALGGDLHGRAWLRTNGPLLHAIG